ncbi:glycosyltransferase family 1 protein [Opitutus sp. GAS368]|jgi:glycosyltransferase involved in cell wall biosynthesis|uniref:glycosyltransferase family 4 protein n=1 Tax=Opitutus sp. GAS368 TaxID=1882749 RepID=UPI00087961A9|nr:glycosyltransferase family 1 protein [Opitutus sp. GAS368]SDS24451.1 Glycosyltransferase involved in cell wall bisynthesis [Opitutus sp. GAS368]
MLLLDATHTSHTRAQTGIQRVCRSLYAALRAQQPVEAICHDPYLRAWRSLNDREKRHLAPGRIAAGPRGARWPLHQQIAGHARRLAGARPAVPAGSALVCPELFSPAVGAHLPELLAAVRGPRVAVFHDAIGLKLPELTPPGTVRRLPVYLRELLLFDGIAANSEDSAACLRDYWKWLGVGDTPVVHVMPLGLDPVAPDPQPSTLNAQPRILCVGTIEGRKNHLALLEACAALWTEGLTFELQLLGLPRADTAGPALAKIAALQQAGRPLLSMGAVADDELHAAYRQCAFTVYPSLIEGFGLPVLESLQHGKPCVCSAAGALGESARGGGCVALPSVNAASLAAAIRRLLRNPPELAALAAQGRARPVKSWVDYARELAEWMTTLPRRG